MHRISNTELVSALVVCILGCGLSADGEECLDFTNDTAGIMEVWIWPYSISAWRTAPVRLSPGRTRSLYFGSNEDYFLLVRDHRYHETPIGRVNFTKLREEYPEYQEVRLSKVVRQACGVQYAWSPQLQRYIRVTVSKPVHEETTVTWIKHKTPPRRVARPAAYARYPGRR